MFCDKCNNNGNVEAFLCCKNFEDILNSKCCGIPCLSKELCNCGIIKLYQITYFHKSDEEESEIYINAKSEREAMRIYYSMLENDELPEDSSLSSISEI